jgi:prolyl-tRNA editing enzyme YbaK/EbsC (Cys-tRNA(Pro) deacylase)
MHPSAEKTAAALTSAGAAGEVRELDESTRTAAEAAAAVGCPVAAIVKTLVFVADGEPVIILTSGAHQVDTAFVAATLGFHELRRASADEARRATGQPIGGVAPVGHPAKLRVLVDPELRRFETVWAAAGTPRAVFPTSFDELVRIAAAEETAVTAPPQAVQD